MADLTAAMKPGNRLSVKMVHGRNIRSHTKATTHKDTRIHVV